MRAILLRTVVGLAAVAAVAAGTLLVADLWRGEPRPQPCGAVLLPPARGELVEDADVVAGAWAVLTDRTRGRDLGDPFARERSCVLFAGRIDGDAPGAATTSTTSTTVVLESTRIGTRIVSRIGEVRLGSGEGSGEGEVRVAGYATSVGAPPTDLATVLPLSGRLLVAPGVTAVRVRSAADGFAALAPAPAVADGVHDLGPAMPAAPEDGPRTGDVALLLELDLREPRRPALALVPVLTRDLDGLVERPVLPLTVVGADGREVRDLAPAVTAVVPALPALLAAPRFPALVDGFPAPPLLIAQVRPGVAELRGAADGTTVPEPPLQVPVPATAPS